MKKIALAAIAALFAFSVNAAETTAAAQQASGNKLTGPELTAAAKQCETTHAGNEAEIAKCKANLNQNAQ